LDHSGHGEWQPRSDLIPGDKLRQWITSGDLEVLGYVHSLLDDQRFRSEPPLTLEEYLEFLKRYTERCFVENPESQWASSRYMAGYDLVGAFAAMWRDPAVPRSVFGDIKSWLAEIYRKSSDEVRTCIEQSTLEHLFENPEVRALFADWKLDPVLCTAHKAATEWAEGGGHSHFWEIPR
jgi:hypothetical protein